MLVFVLLECDRHLNHFHASNETSMLPKSGETETKRIFKRISGKYTDNDMTKKSKDKQTKNST